MSIDECTVQSLFNGLVLFCGAIFAGIRMSRCVYIKCCSKPDGSSCCELQRDVIEESTENNV